MKLNPHLQKLKLKLPLFVTFEGGDGSGKTTLIDRLKSYFEEEGHSVIATREPGGSRLGELLRDLLLNHEQNVTIGSKAELFLFLAARAQHVEEVISPALLEDKIVLCDRFTDSSIAYQGYARGLGMENVSALSAFATDELLPDLTFFLDISPEVALQRVGKERQRKLDKIEREERQFHAKVREAFLQIAKENPSRVKILDATEPKELVFRKALSHFYTQRT